MVQDTYTLLVAQATLEKEWQSTKSVLKR